MKANVIFLCGFLLLTTNIIFSQKNDAPQSIITKDAAIRKFHELDELRGMQKGELLQLSAERIKALINILPYAPLVKRAGITIEDLGIPNDADNKKTMDAEAEAIKSFLEVTQEFQRKMLPYSDKSNIIAAILYYESIMKSIREFEEL